MNKKDRTLSILVVFGVGAALVYWLYLKVSDPEGAPSLGDLWDSLQSYGARGYLIVRGKVEKALQIAGASSDPKIIAAGLIAAEEGFSSKVYADPPGQSKTFSIGYGHQLVSGDGFNQASTISQSDGYALLIDDLDSYATWVDSLVEVDITANERAALYSFCYNEGKGAFQNSTLLKDINNGDLGAASQEFDRWVYAGGAISQALVNRRNDEQDLFNS